MIDTEFIAENISKKLCIPSQNIKNTISLIVDGASIPFISRYRKEKTGNLDETQIQEIADLNQFFCDLFERKTHIIKTISELGKLTPDLEQSINSCWDKNQLEDLYLPYKPKRRTKAEVARLNGLEPLAKVIMSQKYDEYFINKQAATYINDAVSSASEAVNGASHIIAEWISENSYVRNRLRTLFNRFAQISASVIKGKEEEGDKYSNYFNSSSPHSKCFSQKTLAIMRAEREGF